MPRRRVDDAPTDSVGMRASDTDEADERAEAEVILVFVRARVAVDCWRDGASDDDDEAAG